MNSFQQIDYNSRSNFISRDTSNEPIRTSLPVQHMSNNQNNNNPNLIREQIARSESSTNQTRVPPLLMSRAVGSPLPISPTSTEMILRYVGFILISLVHMIP
jgi:hypothetical protein